MVLTISSAGTITIASAGSARAVSWSPTGYSEHGGRGTAAAAGLGMPTK